MPDNLLTAINKLLTLHRDQDDLIPHFYKEVPKSFPDTLDYRIVNLYVQRLCTVVTAFLTRKQLKTPEDADPISPKDRDIITFLGGYAFGYKYRKTLKVKGCLVKHKDRLRCLMAVKIADSNETQHQFTKYKSRGSLWLVNVVACQMFEALELAIRPMLKFLKKNIKQNIDDIISSFFNDITFSNLIDFLVIEHELELEFCENILHEVIFLYIRVIVYSTLKDYNKNLQSSKVGTRKTLYATSHAEATKNRK